MRDDIITEAIEEARKDADRQAAKNAPFKINWFVVFIVVSCILMVGMFGYLGYAIATETPEHRAERIANTPQYNTNTVDAVIIDIQTENRFLGGAWRHDYRITVAYDGMENTFTGRTSGWYVPKFFESRSGDTVQAHVTTITKRGEVVDRFISGVLE